MDSLFLGKSLEIRIANWEGADAVKKGARLSDASMCIGNAVDIRKRYSRGGHGGHEDEELKS